MQDIIGNETEENILKMKLILGEDKFKEWVEFMLSTIEAIYGTSNSPNPKPPSDKS